MKKLIFASALFSVFIFASCRKARTCSCDATITSTNTTVPRNGGAITIVSNTSTNKSENTYAKIKKSEMKRLIGCVDNTYSSSNSYTTAVFTGTTLSIADVTSQQVNVSTCKIK